MIPGLIIGLLLGLIIGGAGAWYWRGKNDPESALRDLREQNESLRRDVADHFVHTADLVNSLTDSYKEVFDHLRDGAERLVDQDTLKERLSYTGRKQVTLHMIGGGSGTPSGSDSRPDLFHEAGGGHDADKHGVPAEGVEGDAGADSQAPTGHEYDGDTAKTTGSEEPPDPFR